MGKRCSSESPAISQPFHKAPAAKSRFIWWTLWWWIHLSTWGHLQFLCKATPPAAVMLWALTDPSTMRSQMLFSWLQKRKKSMHFEPCKKTRLIKKLFVGQVLSVCCRMAAQEGNINHIWTMTFNVMVHSSARQQDTPMVGFSNSDEHIVVSWLNNSN